MTELDVRLVAKAEELILRFGRTVTYSSITRVYDEVSGTSTETVTDFTPKISPLYDFEEDFQSGDVIQRSKAKTILHNVALGFRPRRSDRFVVDGETWTVLVVHPYMSGEQIAAWELVVAR